MAKIKRHRGAANFTKAERAERVAYRKARGGIVPLRTRFVATRKASQNAKVRRLSAAVKGGSAAKRTKINTRPSAASRVKAAAKAAFRARTRTRRSGRSRLAMAQIRKAARLKIGTKTIRQSLRAARRAAQKAAQARMYAARAQKARETRVVNKLAAALKSNLAKAPRTSRSAMTTAASSGSRSATTGSK
jgi:hypothetical protein